MTAFPPVDASPTDAGPAAVVSAAPINTPATVAAAFDRIDRAVARIERALAARASLVNRIGETDAELNALRSRHARLKDQVARELAQLDLLLSGLPE